MKDKATLLVKRLQDAGHTAVFAGGAVRDQLLGKSPKDIDICSSALPDQIQEILSSFHIIPTGAAFGVLTVIVDGDQFQIATFREDSSNSDGRRPDEVRFVATLQEDAARRDLTINSLFYDPIKDQVIDFFDGQADLEKGLVRFVGRPVDRIQEDHLRVLRAVRFSTRFGFRLVDEIDIQRSGHLLKNISRERITAEFKELLINPLGLPELHRLDLMKYIIPGIEALSGLAGEQDSTWHAEGNCWVHSLMVVDILRQFQPDNFDLLLAGLLHDIGKPSCQKCFGDGKISNLKHAEIGADMAENICRFWMKLPNETVRFVTELVREHMSMHQVHKLEHADLIELMERPYINEMVLLQHADTMGRTTLEPKESHLEFMQSKLAEFALLPLHRRPSAKSIIGGDDLIARGLTPGPDFKSILGQARRAQMDGRFDPEDKATFLDSLLQSVKV